MSFSSLATEDTKEHRGKSNLVFRLLFLCLSSVSSVVSSLLISSEFQIISSEFQTSAAFCFASCGLTEA
jgi:hypothetical protein